MNLLQKIFGQPQQTIKDGYGHLYLHEDKTQGEEDILEMQAFAVFSKAKDL